MIRQKPLMTLILTLLLCVFSGNSQAAAPNVYKFGVFPFMPMSALIKYYNSISTDFTRNLKKRVIAQTKPTFKEFSEQIEKETYDIIFIQPFDYPKAYAHNYRPIARRSDDLDAILVTLANSDIENIKDLKGKTVANPPLESAISIVIKNEFNKSGMDAEKDLKMLYTANHFACIQMVLVKKTQACATTTPVLKHWQSSQLKKKKLRVVHQSNFVPHTLYMVHTRVPEQDKEKLKQAILSWDKRPAGKMILKTFNLNAFTEAKDSDYDVIRNFWQQDK